MFYFIYWFLNFSLWELILRTALSPAFFSRYLLLTLCFCGLYAAIAAMLAKLLPKRARRAYFIILNLFFTVLYVSQFIYYRIFKVLYTVNSIGKAGQAMEFMKDTLLQMAGSVLAIVLLLLPLIFVIINPLWDKVKDFIGRDRVREKTAFYLPMAGIMLFAAILTIVLATGSDQVNSPRHLLFEDNLPLVAADRMGVLTAMIRDFSDKPGEDGGKLLILDPSEKTGENAGSEGSEDTDASRSSESAKAPASTAAPSESHADPTPTPEPLFTPEKQVLPSLDFAALAASEENETYKNLDLYFAQADPSLTNEKSGLYEGYNFIFITAESFSPYAIHPELTPTLYYMYQNGYHFSNFYNPVWGVSTLDGEYAGLLGTIPKAGVWSMTESADNVMDYAPGNMLRRQGYKTYAYHNHTYTYYDRQLSHPNLGYDYKGLGNGLEVTPVWPESDLEMMELSVDEYINEDKFHVYYLTVSGHMYYTFNGNMMASRHREAVEDLPMPEEAKAYLACNMEFDLAMEYLLRRLREKGIADKTLIAVNPDHYPYGLEKESIDFFAGKSVEENFELYRSCFLLYTDGMTPETNDKAVCSLDCMPTCYNLLGLPYDSRLLSGRDAFSPTEGLCIFMNRSWITDQGRYNALNGEFEADFKLNSIAKQYPGYREAAEKTAAEVAADPAAYVERINQKVANRFNAAANVLDFDYYAYLRDKTS